MRQLANRCATEELIMTSLARLTHVANVEDDSTDEAFEVFKYVKVGGRRGTLFVEREVADEAKQVRLRLRKHNAALSPIFADSMREVEKAIRAQPLRLFRYAASTGWLPDGKGFVTAYGTIDSVNRRQKILPPRRLNAAQRRGAKPEGDLEGWKKEVAVPCGYSDLAITILSAAFAAPVLKVVGRPSFGLNIHGLAKTGKSAILVVGSSVGGAGREEELPNWAATSAAVGEFCRLYCDRFMPINEVGLIKKKDAYGKIQPAIYQMAEGRERDRHSKSSFAITDDSGFHRTIFVSTAEHSFDYYAQLAGETRDEGEHARCVEVTAVRKGHMTVIDRWPASVPLDQRNAWARKLLKRVRNGCEQHHSVAMTPYVEFLMQDVKRAERHVKGYMAEFMEGLDTTRMSGAMEHAAENLSLIYAGGCVAIDAGVLPYQKSDVLRAVERCFRDALQTAAEESDPLLRAKRLLRRCLESNRIFEVKSPNDSFDARRFDGYVANCDGRWRYVIRAASLRDWLKTELGAARGIVEWLEERRRLLARQPRSLEKADRPTDWAERIFVWPDKSSVRSMVFYDPFEK
jgi:Domain of unknown function (DUF927)